MLIAIVDFTVTPESRAAALAALAAEAPGVRAMPGNLAYRPYLDPEDPGAIRIFHEWEDAPRFAAYTASEGFRRSGAVLRPLMTAPPLSRRMSAQLLEALR